MKAMFSQLNQQTGSFLETARDPYLEAAAGIQAAWLLRTCPRGDDSVQDSAVVCTSYRIGRVSGNDLRISDRTVSGNHAELTLNGESLFVRDLNSTNGTFVNGNRISGVEQLHDGDLLQLGTMKLQILHREESTSSSTVSADVAGHALAHFQFDKLLAQPAVCPYFQPIVRMADAVTVGYEILGRSRLMGLESPAEMFRVAAERSLECNLSRVLREEGMRIANRLDNEFCMYVNTHPEELHHDGLLESLKSLRDQNPVIPIMLEVHEAAVTSSQMLLELRAQLNDLEIGLAYDDFGAGQARLVELSDVPPDVIKFDLKFVQGLGEATAERRRLVGTLVKMVRDLGVVPLAEGVELKSEADVCQELEFELAQGYYFGRPAPVSKWLPDSAV